MLFTTNNYRKIVVGYKEIVLFNMKGTFLGSCARWRKAIICFDKSVCLSSSQYAWKNRLTLEGFSRNLIFECFPKICRQN